MRRVLFGIAVALLLLVAGCSSYVRLRGSNEIHDPGCFKVRNASADGVVDADLDDGVPCIYCLHDEAVEYEEDNR